VIPLLSHRTRLLLELRSFDFFLLRKWWCHRVWPRIITVVIFPPAFFLNSCCTLYSLSNVTFIVSWEYVLFELRLFDFFRWRNLREKVCDPESLLSLIFLLHFFEFVFRIVFAL
jgi:hypothetical protein